MMDINCMTDIQSTPIDETDFRVVCQIIEAAIWYTTEERVDLESLIPSSTQFFNETSH